MIRTRNLSHYVELHRSGGYGPTATKKLPLIEPWVQLSRPRTVLDYGAGQSSAVNELRCSSITIRHRFDPAIEAISRISLSRYDFVTCIDVMEHFDPDEVPMVIKDIARITNRAVFAIDLVVAKTVLPNGENAHATVRPTEWWLSVVREHFKDAEAIPGLSRRAIIKTWRSSWIEWGLFRLLTRWAKVTGRFEHKNS